MTNEPQSGVGSARRDAARPSSTRKFQLEERGVTKERPILFSAPMVRAILDGRKTQTRRVVKHAERIEQFERNRDGSFYYDFMDDLDPAYVRSRDVPCPYGVPGDTLWVRERTTYIGDDYGWAHVRYDADGADLSLTHKAGASPYTRTGKSVPSIHMPRWASRITLRITDVRVQRLHDISEADARAEGVGEPYFGDGDPPFEEPGVIVSRWMQFRNLWKTINGEGSWAANPWVWAVSFEPLTAAPPATPDESRKPSAQSASNIND